MVAIYATFLNRAFDQVLMDVALHRQAVTFVLDRAGVTGDDGPSHNGMWDLSILQVVPGLRIAAPRDGDRLRELFAGGGRGRRRPDRGPVPEGPGAGAGLPAVDPVGGLDVLHRSGAPDVLLVSVGAMAPVVPAAPRRCWPSRRSASPWSTRAGSSRWTRRWPTLAARHRLVVTVEDNGRVGGVGAAVAQALRDAEVDTPVRTLGVPQAVPGPRQAGPTSWPRSG